MARSVNKQFTYEIVTTKTGRSLYTMAKVHIFVYTKMQIRNDLQQIQSFHTMGRWIKRQFKRTETLKTRLSKEHKNLLWHMQEAAPSSIVSQADIIEWALEDYARHQLGIKFDHHTGVITKKSGH